MLEDHVALVGPGDGGPGEEEVDPGLLPGVDGGGVVGGQDRAGHHEVEQVELLEGHLEVVELLGDEQFLDVLQYL